MTKIVYRALARVFSVVLIVLGIGALIGGNFAHGSVTEQLAQEKISMPSQEAIDALDDVESRDLLTPHIGEELTTGDQAQLFANNFIWQHMMAAADGKTYQEVSNEYLAAKKAGTASADELNKMKSLRETMFYGDSLRGMLLNAYGWWFLGTIAIYSGVVFIAGGIILAVLGFGVWRNKEKSA